MPIPILVAVVAAVISAAGGTAGTVVYKNNKHNKEKGEWQKKRKELQDKIAQYQNELARSEEQISTLQKKLAERTIELDLAARKLKETDEMIEVLELRQRELESYKTKIAKFLSFKLGSHHKDSIQVQEDLNDFREFREKYHTEIAAKEDEKLSVEREIENFANQKNYLKNEINDIESQLCAFRG